jgi:outer membrane protein TolC
MLKTQSRQLLSNGFYTFIIYLTIFSCLHLTQTRQVLAAEQVTIAVLFDSQQANRDLFLDSLRQETSALLGTKYNISIDEERIATTSWSRQSVLSEYQKFAADEEVDIILAIGPLNSAILAKLGKYPKPLILMGILDPALQQIPLTQEGKSGVSNLTYILLATEFERDLNDFYEVFPYESLAIIIDKKLAELIPNADEIFKQYIATKGVIGTMVVYDSNIDELIDTISLNSDAVFYGGLYRMPKKEKQKLIDHVNLLQLPSFAFQGEKDVAIGALAGTTPEAHLQKITRRLALNIEKILAGLNPANFSTLLSFEKRLQINMETARKINFSPTWSILAKAELINEDYVDSERVLDFESIVRQALSSNLSLSIEKLAVVSATENVAQAKSDLFPSLDASITTLKIDDQSAGLFQAEETTSGKLAVGQVVYADKIWTNLFVQQHLLNAADAKRLEVLLDTVQNAGIYYLDILRFKTNETIRKNYLVLVRRNFEIAEYRERIGYSGVADVYRWKSELAKATQDLLEAQSALRVAKIRLNEFLLRPLDEEFGVKDVGLTEQLFQRYGSEKIKGYVNTPKSLGLLTEFLLTEAKKNLPELKQLQEAIAAEEKILSASKRKRFLPTVTLQSQADYIFSRQGEGAELLPDEETNWNVSLNASWELFSGGKINADTRKSHSELTKLEMQLQDVTRKVELRLRQAVLDLRVKSANLRLSKDSAEAAGKNFELVRDAYSKGTTSLVSLLDAQNAALSADRSAANSVYEYFISLLTVERTFGNFAVISSLEEQKAFFQRFVDYMTNKPASQ